MSGPAYNALRRRKRELMREHVEQHFPTEGVHPPGHGIYPNNLPGAIYCNEEGTGRPVKLDIPWLEEAAEVTVEAWNNLRQNERLTQCAGY